MSTRSRIPYATSSSSVGSSAEDERAVKPILVEIGRLPVDAEKRRTRGHELPERGNKLKHAIDTLRLLDQLLGADLGDDAGLASRNDRR